MMEKRSIIYVNPFASKIGVSGADLCLLDYIKILKEEGKYDIYVVLPVKSQFNKERRVSYYYEDYVKAGANVVYMNMCLLYRTLNPYKILKNLLMLIPNIIGLVKLIKEKRAILVHSNNMTLLAPGIAAKIMKVPSIYHVREIIREPKIASIIYPYLITKLADKIICISEAVANMFLRFKTSSEKLRIIYDGIDLQEFHPGVDGDNLRRELKIKDEVPLIGMVGRIHPRKGHIYFIEAAKMIKEGVPEAKFVVVGWIDSEFKPYVEFLESLKKRIRELGLENDFYFLGNRRDVANVMKALTVHVMPSASSKQPEPFGRVVVEAMAVGTPVVASNDGGAAEIIDADCGILVPPKDPKAIATAVSKIIKDKNLHQKYSINSVKKVKEKFDMRESTKKIMKIYESFIMS